MHINEVREHYSLDRVVPYFQPIMDIQHDAVWRYECLARLVAKDHQVFLPSEFLDLVQRDNRIPDLTQTMFQQSSHYFRHVSIPWNLNIDARDMANIDMLEYMSQFAQDAPDSGRLSLEITAKTALEHTALLAQFIEQCQQRNIGVIIDRCDHACEALIDIFQLPIDGLKVSSVLIREYSQPPSNGADLTTLLNAARAQHINIIAECIEDYADLEAVKSAGIRYAQGYAFSKPSRHLS